MTPGQTNPEPYTPIAPEWYLNVAFLRVQLCRRDPSSANPPCSMEAGAASSLNPTRVSKVARALTTAFMGAIQVPGSRMGAQRANSIRVVVKIGVHFWVP